MASKRYYFYVLYCKDQTLYAGYTVNLTNRLQTHNEGKGAKYTRLAKRRPAVMIYAESYNTRSQAMSAEAKFKRLTRKEKERYLRDNGQANIKSKQFVLVNKMTKEEAGDEPTTKL